MGKTIRILTNNYSGYTGSIIYYPYTGGTINLGSHILPYDYDTDYYYGTYEIYISEYDKTCILKYPPPVCDFTGVEEVTPTPTPTPLACDFTYNVKTTPTPTPTNTQTPTYTPTPTPTPTEPNSDICFLLSVEAVGSSGGYWSCTKEKSGFWNG